MFLKLAVLYRIACPVETLVAVTFQMYWISIQMYAVAILFTRNPCNPYADT